VAGSFSPVFSADHPRDALSAVQAAHEAEAKGALAVRAGLMEDASYFGKEVDAAHWLQGEVKSGGKWKSYEQLVTDAARSSTLAEYQAARAKAAASIDGQSQLAKWCEQNGLFAQAGAHWQAVVQLDPNHELARKSLGFVREDGNGNWVSLDKQRADQEFKQRSEQILLSKNPTLFALAQELEANGRTVGEVAIALESDADGIANIHAWESVLSSRGSKGGLAVVAALNALPAPEAAQSLLKHALDHPADDVREAATSALARRDELSYVPTLLAELRGPWEGTAQTRYDSRSASATTTYQVRSERQEYIEIKVLADSVAMTADGTSARATVKSRELKLEGQRREANAQIEDRNKKCINLLRTLIGEFSLHTPEQCWQWWDNRCEFVRPQQKIEEVTTAIRNGADWDGAESPFVRTSSEFRMYPPPRRDCLAAGTLILTNRGPIAVEKILVGDMVLSRHPVSGETTFKPVVRTTTRPPEKLLSIEFDDLYIRASGGHPFWVSGKGWVRARDLQRGMHVHGLAEPVRVSSVTEEAAATQSYNLILQDFHTYFVQTGDVRVLSHDNTMRDAVRTTVPGLVPANEGAKAVGAPKVVPPLRRGRR